MRKVIAPLFAVAALGVVLLVGTNASATEGCVIPVTDDPSCTYTADQTGTYVAAAADWSISIVHPDSTTTTLGSAQGSAPVGVDVIQPGDIVTATVTGPGVLAVGNAAP